MIGIDKTLTTTAQHDLAMIWRCTCVTPSPTSNETRLGHVLLTILCAWLYGGIFYTPTPPSHKLGSVAFTCEQFHRGARAILLHNEFENYVFKYHCRHSRRGQWVKTDFLQIGYTVIGAWILISFRRTNILRKYHILQKQTKPSRRLFQNKLRHCKLCFSILTHWRLSEHGTWDHLLLNLWMVTAFVSFCVRHGLVVTSTLRTSI